MSVVMVSWTLLLGNTFSLLVTISLLSEGEVAKAFFYFTVGTPNKGTPNKGSFPYLTQNLENGIQY